MRPPARPERPHLPAPQRSPALSSAADVLDTLSTGRIEEIGLIPGASNLTCLVAVTSGDRTIRAVAKPTAGERPLRDFPTGTLAARETAAFALSDGLCLDVVPPTVLRDDLGLRSGPGGGSLQAWVEEALPADVDDPAFDDEEAAELAAAAAPVRFEAPEAVSPDVAPILAAELEDGSRVLLVHEADERMRRIALLDALTANADRKGGHLIRGTWESDPAAAERIWAIDNGLCFGTGERLRTVLWGFAGDPLTADETALLADLRIRLADDSPLRRALTGLLDEAEVDAVGERASAMLSSGTLPDPPEDRTAVPWPLL